MGFRLLVYGLGLGVKGSFLDSRNSFRGILQGFSKVLQDLDPRMSYLFGWLSFLPESPNHSKSYRNTFHTGTERNGERFMKLIDHDYVTWQNHECRASHTTRHTEAACV